MLSMYRLEELQELARKLEEKREQELQALEKEQEELRELIDIGEQFIKQVKTDEFPDCRVQSGLDSKEAKFTKATCFGLTIFGYRSFNNSASYKKTVSEEKTCTQYTVKFGRASRLDSYCSPNPQSTACSKAPDATDMQKELDKYEKAMKRLGLENCHRGKGLGENSAEVGCTSYSDPRNYGLYSILNSQGSTYRRFLQVIKNKTYTDIVDISKNCPST